MFDLEKGIREWRRRLGADPSLEEGFCAELESHLRDKVDDLVRAGREPEAAFREAARALGESASIGPEFHKVHTTQRTGRPSWQAPRFVPGLAWSSFKVAVRLIRRNKLHSLINIAGLSVGLGCFVLFFLSWRYEHSYDRARPDADRIYRVERTSGEFGTTEKRPSTQAPLAPAMVRNFPEVAQAGRIRSLRKSVIRLGDWSVIDDRVAACDPEAVDLLGLSVLAGGGPRDLSSPDLCLMTERAARAYFGGESPLGKALMVSISWGANRTREFMYTVSGVLRDPPSNSSFSYDLYLPISTLSRLLSDSGDQVDYLETWGQPVFLTLALLKPDADIPALEKKMTAIAEGKDRWEAGTLSLTPLASVHASDPAVKKYLFLFGTIALIVLLLACVNTVNLTTARGVQRLKEVGVRKIAGADRARLIGQFLGESVVSAFLALILALALIQLFLPAFRSMTSRELRVGEIAGAGLLAAVAGIALLTGLAAGAYSAFRLSRIQPVELFQQMRTEKTSRGRLRRSLVFVQFLILGVFLAAALAFSRQLSFIRRADLGLDRDHIYIIRLSDARFLDRGFQDRLKSKLAEWPAIKATAAMFATPPDLDIEVPIRPENAPQAESEQWNYFSGDERLLEMFSLDIVEGRNFGPDAGSGEIQDCLINETAARRLGPGPAVGKLLRETVHDEVFNRLRVIGVVRDFNHRTLHHPITPLVIPRTRFGTLLAVKLSPAVEPAGTMKAIDAAWRSLSPGRPLDGYFLDEAFDRAYLAEARLGRLIRLCSGLALFIAALGLFGLVSFNAAQRRKETGIRKILGASWRDLAALFLRDLGRPVLFSSLLAWPAAFFLIRTWFREFAFRTNVPAWIYLAGSGLGLAVALLTVCAVIVRAAGRNPAEALRYE